MITLIIKFHMAMIIQTSKTNAFDDHIAAFAVNLSKMNGKGSSEVNLIYDMGTFEVK